MIEFIERVLALFIFILLFPVFLIIGFFVFIETKTFPIFTQTRVEKKGKVFKIYKFKTMYSEGDKILEDYLSKSSEAREEWKKFKKLKSFDPRITKTGKVLRRLSLDELPQILNIIKGEMSFVGPRPYIPYELEEVDEKIRKVILSVKPGLTGLWQVMGRSKLSFEERVKLDLLYVQKRSLKENLKIILKTFWVVISGEGAY